MRLKYLTVTTMLVALACLTSCGSGGKTYKEAFDPVGEWAYKVTTDVSYGVLTIARNDDGYNASMTTEVFGTLELMDLSIEGTKLSANLDVGGTAAKITCDFDGDSMTGAVTAGDDRFPFEGQRK